MVRRNLGDDVHVVAAGTARICGCHVGVCGTVGADGVRLLGGGRTRPQDPIHFAVGLTELAELGQRIEAGQPLAFVHARTEAAAQRAIADVQAAYTIADTAPAANPIVYRTIRP